MYPYLSLHVYYNNVERFSRINIERRTYELRVVYHSDPTTQTVISVADTNLIVRQHTDNAKYYEQSNKRYIDARYVGDFNIELLYPHPTEEKFITLLETITVFQSGDYPKLRFAYYLNDEKQLHYLDINNQKYEVRIYIDFSESDSIHIPIQDNNTNLRVRNFDRNSFLTVEDNKLYITATEIGSSKLKAYFDYCGEELTELDEIILYNTFFKDNYKNFLIQEQDKRIFEKNIKLKIVYDTLMEFVDIFYAYFHDINGFDNIFTLKDKFIDLTSVSRGLIRNNLYDGQYLEIVFNKLYRELLMNLVDVIGLRGTKLSYELFFGALGYDIELLEYWFDENGHLIEVNYDDPNGSTFYGYYEDGTPLSEQEESQPDPRKNVSANNPYNISNKSKYIRPVLSPKANIYNPLAYTAQQQILIRQYLQYLKPAHCQYLYEVLLFNLTFDQEDRLFSLLDDESSFVSSNLLSVCGDYIDPYDVQTQMTPLSTPPANLYSWVYWVPPPALSENYEFNYSGPFDWQTRGMCIEHLRTMTDYLSLGGLQTFIEAMDFPIRYDDEYEYDGVEPDSVGLQYDKGILFYDVYQNININLFRISYANYQVTYGTDTEAIYTALMSDYNITRTICLLIISLV